MENTPPSGAIRAIRSKYTGHWLTPGGTWTRNIHEARHFDGVEEPLEAIAGQSIANAELVTRFPNSEEPDVVTALPALSRISMRSRPG